MIFFTLNSYARRKMYYLKRRHCLNNSVYIGLNRTNYFRNIWKAWFGSLLLSILSMHVL